MHYILDSTSARIFLFLEETLRKEIHIYINHSCPILRHNEIPGTSKGTSQSVSLFMSHRTVVIFLWIRVRGHFVMPIVLYHESHYVGVRGYSCRSNYRKDTRKG